MSRHSNTLIEEGREYDWFLKYVSQEEDNSEEDSSEDVDSNQLSLNTREVTYGHGFARTLP